MEKLQQGRGRSERTTYAVHLAAVQFTSIVDFMIVMPLGPQLMRSLLVDPTVMYDSALFEIVGNKLRTRIPLDFESRASYFIRVRTTDSFGNFRDRLFTISVLDTQE